jgi:hydrogenase maturation protease
MKPPAGKRNLVIGLGSLLSRDDAFGLLVLDRLLQQKTDPLPDADFIQADTDLLSQIDRFSQYPRVILIDTVLDPDGGLGHRGAVLAINEDVLLTWPETSPSAHQFTPLVAVKLFRKLYPAAHTRITLVAYCTDRVIIGNFGKNTLEEQIINAGIRLVGSLLS